MEQKKPGTEAWDPQVHFSRQLAVVEQAISAHRAALERGKMSAAETIAVTRFITQLEAAGIAKSW
ncbi:hypothetical protein [Mesorhizobium sp. M6A.T.Ce.TU.016.01.1.1]|uniref:hypothetical protein n=1 Tax=Mesorhizobium sp. M6A.T.Ce.TU.016.01.1.1 TaxID=2496783 RepID=UPI000FCA3BB7|nr:hypothetical protein [Mesorhizobium sp. M6A.T.Ce.TU.016.01.1.1]RUU32413.1 hypothetical protein EOC94_02840 [Mesorhizobium sp. M6A.T.Ce.TU.016.01.1.1]